METMGVQDYRPDDGETMGVQVCVQVCGFRGAGCFGFSYSLKAPGDCRELPERHCRLVAAYEIQQLVGVMGIAKLEQRSFLDLANSFTRHLKDFSNLLQRIFFSTLIQTIPQAHNLLFSWREQIQRRIGYLTEILIQHTFIRRNRIFIFNKPIQK